MVFKTLWTPKMKLYELPRYSYFSVDSGVLLNHADDPVYYFDHIDGMYSYCVDAYSKVVHFSASTPVRIVSNPENIDI